MWIKGMKALFWFPRCRNCWGNVNVLFYPNTPDCKIRRICLECFVEDQINYLPEKFVEVHS